MIVCSCNLLSDIQVRSHRCEWRDASTDELCFCLAWLHGAMRSLRPHDQSSLAGVNRRG
jgi:hypothetical protein